MSFADPYEEPDYFDHGHEYDDEEEEPPLFGCACEDPISVDTTCDGCIEYMKALDAEVAGEPPPTPPPPPATEEPSHAPDDLEIPF